MPDTVTISLISTSDCASDDVYPDEGIPSLKAWLAKTIRNPIRFTEALTLDKQAKIEAALKKMADGDRCDLIFATGGTSPTPHNIAPGVTLNVVEEGMPGFGEQMRQISLYHVPTAILSRWTVGMRVKCLIVDLSGRPKAIAETLGGVYNEDGGIEVHGLFSAVPYCIGLVSGPSIKTDKIISKAFRSRQK